MTPPKVFVTQEVFSRGDDGELRVKFDLSEAAAFGRLVFLFGHGPVALSPNAMVSGIVHRLSEERFEPDRDFLLTIGDNVIACALGAVLGATYGRFQVLRWDRRRKGYDVISVQLPQTIELEAEYDERI